MGSEFFGAISFVFSQFFDTASKRRQRAPAVAKYKPDIGKPRHRSTQNEIDDRSRCDGLAPSSQKRYLSECRIRTRDRSIEDAPQDRAYAGYQFTRPTQPALIGSLPELHR